jgi:hypothetical protein
MIGSLSFPLMATKVIGCVTARPVSGVCDALGGLFSFLCPISQILCVSHSAIRSAADHIFFLAKMLFSDTMCSLPVGYSLVLGFGAWALACDLHCGCNLEYFGM